MAICRPYLFDMCKGDEYMIFLGTVFYDSKDNSMFGAITAEYDQTGFDRAHLDIVDSENIMTVFNNKETSGFTINNGVLLSDAQPYYICDREKYNFFRDYIKDTVAHKDVDLIDFLKTALRMGAYILPNYGTDFKENPIFISISSLKISNSSINIYAVYLDKEEWNVISLYDSTKIEPKEFAVAIPKDSDVSTFNKYIKFCGETELNNTSYNIYLCKLPILGVADLPDSIINYLAFTVAEKEIYCKVLDKYIATVYTNENKIKYPSSSKLKQSRQTKTNISIEHSLAKCDCIDLARELSLGPKDSFSSKQLELVVNFIRHTDKLIDDSPTKDTLGICTFLRSTIKEEIVCHSLELLSIRVGLLSVLDGRTLETSAMVLKGGGVFGTTTVKRIGW